MTERHFRITKLQGALLVSLLGLARIEDRFSQSEIAVFETLKGQINDSLVDQLPQLKELRIYYEKLSLQRQSSSSELDEHQRKIREQFGLEDVPERGDGVVLIDIVSPLHKQIEDACRQFATARLRAEAEKAQESEKGGEKAEKEGERFHFLTQEDADGSVRLEARGERAAPIQATE